MTPIAVAGVVPRDVVTPLSIGELAIAVRGLHDARKPFAFVGGGTHLELGNAPRALDTVIRMTALDAVVDYTPEDQTITVEAGITLAELDRVLEPHGQMLPLDVADRARSTVGGLVATNAYGRRRQRYGTAKDLIVGVGIVRPDGVRARGGGKVVKNVAGFDLPKLMVGSLGTLGAIATVTFRLYPIAQTTRAAALMFEHADDAVATARALIHRRLEPESVALYNQTTLVVSFAGTQRGVDAQMSTLLDEIVPVTPARARELSELERESYEQRERAVRRDGAWRLRIVAPPATAVATLGAFGDMQPLAVPVAYPLLGVALHAYADAPAPPDGAGTDGARHAAGVRERVAARTRGAGNVVIAAMPDTARGSVDAWGPPPPSFALMRAMKHNFDPNGLCNPGRFIGGL
jgi:glycolate oxidase FAD binding subunit